MGDWGHYLWLAAPTLISLVTTLRSWSKKWPFPKRVQAVIRTRWRMEKALFDMTVERDDAQAGEERQRVRAEYYKDGSYDLMEEIKGIHRLASAKDLAASSGSSPPPSVPTVQPLIEVHARQGPQMPTSSGVSHKQNARLRRPKRLLPSADGNGKNDPTTPGRKSSGAGRKKGIADVE